MFFFNRGDFIFAFIFVIYWLGEFLKKKIVDPKICLDNTVLSSMYKYFANRIIYICNLLDRIIS